MRRLAATPRSHAVSTRTGHVHNLRKATVPCRFISPRCCACLRSRRPRRRTTPLLCSRSNAESLPAGSSSPPRGDRPAAWFGRSGGSCRCAVSPWRTTVSSRQRSGSGSAFSQWAHTLLFAGSLLRTSTVSAASCPTRSMCWPVTSSRHTHLTGCVSIERVCHSMTTFIPHLVHAASALKSLSLRARSGHPHHDSAALSSRPMHNSGSSE